MIRKLIGTIILMFCSLGLLGQTPSTSALHVKKFVAPSYPAVARKARVQGTTTSELQIRADGTVDSIKTVAHPLFRDYVEKALKQWVFEPTGVAGVLKVTVKFSLDEDCNRMSEESVIETRVQADLPDSVSVNTCLEPITIDTH